MASKVSAEVKILDAFKELPDAKREFMLNILINEFRAKRKRARTNKTEAIKEPAA